MTANPVEQIGGITTTANVPKADFISWVKTRVAQVMADANEVRSTQLAGQQAIEIKALRETFFLDTSDTTTADDGITCIISADGGRYKPLLMLSNKSIDGDENTITNIENASLKQVGAATIKGNPTAATADVEDFTIQGLDLLAAPHATEDFLLGYDHVSGKLMRVEPGSVAPQSFVNTIDALKAVDSTAHANIIAMGYYAIGDCHPRAYYFDAADTSSTDNGGTIIVATDSARWKLVGNRLTCKMFGAKTDGTDATTQLNAAVTYAAAQNLPLEFDGNFSTPQLSISSKSGLNFIGRGGLVGIASSATDALLKLIDCTDVTFSGRFVINCAFNTNYTSGLLGATNTGTTQLIDITNVIFNGCPIGWIFGSTAHPDATVSEINIRGGRTFGCPGIGKLIGTNTVVNVDNATLESDYGSGSGAYASLPAVGIEVQGATLTVANSEALATNITTDSLFKISAIAGANGNIYGNVSITGGVIENANALLTTSANSLTSPSHGSFSMSNVNFETSHDDVDYIQGDSSFAGRIVVAGFGHAELPGGGTRSKYNINVANAGCQVFTDIVSFGHGFPQGYAGISGGTQYVIGYSASATERVITTTSATQAANDSYIVFATSGTCTFTMLDPTNYPGRKVTFRNAGSNAINSASSNINSIAGAPGTSILSASSGKFVTLRASGSVWQVESAN